MLRSYFKTGLGINDPTRCALQSLLLRCMNEHGKRSFRMSPTNDPVRMALIPPPLGASLGFGIEESAQVKEPSLSNHRHPSKTLWMVIVSVEKRLKLSSQSFLMVSGWSLPAVFWFVLTTSSCRERQG